MKKKKLGIIILYLLTRFCFSQNMKDEIININKAYYKTTEIAIQMHSKVFKENSTSPFQESKVTMYRTPGNYLYINGTTESMANYNYKLSVNHSKKVIMVNKVTSKAPVNKNPQGEFFDKEKFGLQLDTMLAKYESTSIKTLNENIRELKFKMREGPFEVITIRYNTKTYDVLEFICKTRPNEIDKEVYICVVKNSYLEKTAIKNFMFSEKRFITIKNKKIIPVEKYAEYRIVNLNDQNI